MRHPRRQQGRCDGRDAALNGALLVAASAASSNPTAFHCVTAAFTSRRAAVTVAPAGIVTPVKRSPRKLPAAEPPSRARPGWRR